MKQTCCFSFWPPFLEVQNHLFRFFFFPFLLLCFSFFSFFAQKSKKNVTPISMVLRVCVVDCVFPPPPFLITIVTIVIKVTKHERLSSLIFFFFSFFQNIHFLKKNLLFQWQCTFLSMAQPFFFFFFYVSACVPEAFALSTSLFFSFYLQDKSPPDPIFPSQIFHYPPSHSDVKPRNRCRAALLGVPPLGKYSG